MFNKKYEKITIDSQLRYCQKKEIAHKSCFGSTFHDASIHNLCL